MKPQPQRFVHSALVCGLALALAGCASGISERIQEKSAVFDQLNAATQKNIREGTVEPGYTADMVYMALGKPSKVQVKDTSHGKVGIWSYANFYPESYETAPAAGASAASSATTPDAGVVTADPSTAGTTHRGQLAQSKDSTVPRAPAAGTTASDDAGREAVPATSSFVKAGSPNYGYVKNEQPDVSYTATDRRGFKPFVANETTFGDRSGAMEALDVPDMDSASLHVIFFEGRVVSMKMGRN